MTQPACRFCRSPLTLDFLDLGDQPLANSYLSQATLDAGTEGHYPLHARVCEACFLVQVDDPVAFDVIFDDQYAYFSSYSASWVAHAKRYADSMVPWLGLDSNSLVMEIASNDGYLLQHFAAKGIPVLGIEPTANTAAVAVERGVPTEISFFNAATAADLAARGITADLIAANNVLAHVPDIADFVAGFPIVLKDEGVLTFEFPQLLTQIELIQFDTIYHEHFSYLSLLSVEKVLAANGLKVFDVGLLSTHGGSLRLFCAHAGSAHRETLALFDLRAREEEAGLASRVPYEQFATRAAGVRDGFLRFLDEAERQDKSVAAYGAAAKGNTFLNYAGVTSDRIKAVFDASPHKQGRYLPGSHVPILAPSEVARIRPDYLIILPWNLKGEIMEQMAVIRGWGGKFVIATPHVEILD
ncbi:class I SAM-dependent methyltransferase [Rhizorhabdus argentea]|uniref:class I SAM-dependent methyltransferase n=1 Tax=Rhizorhabdus argentea TaxID=1387174 RepID=UPI0030ED92C2